ncbi:MAG: apolipoprotein N-acyltransferase [Bdellovibrionota bacterium]
MSQQRIKKSLKRVPIRSIGYGFASAALMVLTFPSYSIWGLTFLGMIPFLIGLFSSKSYREVAWLGATTMVFFILLGFGWISFVATNFGGLPWIVGKIVLLLFSLFGELQFLLFALVAFALLRRFARHEIREPLKALLILCLLPALYVGLDYHYPKMFPNTFGHVLYGWFPLIQVVEYTGVHALTFPIMVCNMALTVLLLRALLKRKRLVGMSFTSLLPRPSSAAVALALVAIGFGFGHEWGAKRLSELDAMAKTYAKPFRFSVIQANIGDVEKLASERGFEPAIRKVLGTYRDMTRETVARFKPDLVIWPETAYPYLYTHFSDLQSNRLGSARDAWVTDLVSEVDTPLFFGTYSADRGKDFNSAFLVAPPNALIGKYRKSILLAFGEYVPLGPLSGIVQAIVPSIADFGRGRGAEVLELGGVRIGPQICYEGIFPEHSRESIKLGADLLLNITNDSWFGEGTEPWLHLLLTAFRSIELRRPMIRATNTGISTVVDITGEMRWSTRLFESAFLEATLHLPAPDQPKPETFYFKHGDIVGRAFGWVAFLAVAFLGSIAVFERRKRNG